MLALFVETEEASCGSVVVYKAVDAEAVGPSLGGADLVHSIVSVCFVCIHMTSHVELKHDELPFVWVSVCSSGA